MDLEAIERKDNKGIYDVYNKDTGKHSGFTISQGKTIATLHSPQFSTVTVANTVDEILALYKNETRIKVLDHNDTRVTPVKHKPKIWQ